MKPGWTMAARPDQVIAALGVMKARDAALERAAIELQGEWKDVLNQPGSGRVYPAGLTFITKGGRVIPIAGSPGHPSRSADHQASAPGEAPAPDIGSLRQSIDYAKVGEHWRVGTGKRHGLALEYGVNVAGTKVGPHPGKNYVLQPRPHARPAKEAAKDGMTEGMRYTMGRGTKAPRIERGGNGR